MIDLYSVHLDKVQALVPHLYADVLNTHEKEQVNRQKIDSVRSQRILSRGFLRLVLSTKTSEHAKNIQLCTTKYGKPYLENNSLYFNVSHTNKLLVLAFSTQHEVGIDIEYINTDLQAATMPKQCFHPQEREYFQTLTHDNKQAFFLNMWTKKEAISKALGLGFQLLFNTLNTLNSKNPVCINSKHIRQLDITTPHGHYITALAAVSSDTCQLSPWQAPQHQWIDQCLM